MVFGRLFRAVTSWGVNNAPAATLSEPTMYSCNERFFAFKPSVHVDVPHQHAPPVVPAAAQREQLPLSQTIYERSDTMEQGREKRARRTGPSCSESPFAPQGGETLATPESAEKDATDGTLQAEGLHTMFVPEPTQPTAGNAAADSAEGQPPLHSAPLDNHIETSSHPGTQPDATNEEHTGGASQAGQGPLPHTTSPHPVPASTLPSPEQGPLPVAEPNMDAGINVTAETRPVSAPQSPQAVDSATEMPDVHAAGSDTPLGDQPLQSPTSSSDDSGTAAQDQDEEVWEDTVSTADEAPHMPASAAADEAERPTSDAATPPVMEHNSEAASCLDLREAMAKMRAEWQQVSTCSAAVLNVCFGWV